MDILISFSASVGVVEALKTVKDVAVDIVNQSIVLSLKNKKIPTVFPDRPMNSRDINKDRPPKSFYPPGLRVQVVWNSYTEQRYQRWEIGGKLAEELEYSLAGGIVTQTRTLVINGVEEKTTWTSGTPTSGGAYFQNMSLNDFYNWSFTAVSAGSSFYSYSNSEYSYAEYRSSYVDVRSFFVY